MALVRELTNSHEECVRGMSAELPAEVAARGEVRGECVVVIAAPDAAELEDRRRAALGGPSTLEEAIAQGLAAGESKSALAKRLAKSFSLPKAQVYDKILEH